MKRLFALLLALVMVFALVACGNDAKDPTEGNKQTEAQGTEATKNDATEAAPAATAGDYLAAFGYAESDFSNTPNFSHVGVASMSGDEIKKVGIYVSEALSDDDKYAWVSDVLLPAFAAKSEDGKLYAYEAMTGGIRDSEFVPNYAYGSLSTSFAYRADGKVYVINLAVMKTFDQSGDEGMLLASFSIKIK